MGRKTIDLKERNIWVKTGLMLGPLLLLIITLESGTRLLIWAFYGDPNRGMSWEFEYEPYLLTKTKGSDRLHQDTSPKGESYRIVLIGGSTAQQIPEKLLEDAFQTRTDRKVEVINLGQAGYIINQERIALLLYGIRHDPDLVISLDGLNDISTTTKTKRPGITYSNDFIAFAIDHPILNSVASVFRKSQFVNSIFKLRERRTEKLVHKDIQLVEQLIDHIEEGLHSISIIAKGMDIPYIMVLQPYVHLRKNPLEIEKKGLVHRFKYRGGFMSETFRMLNDRLSKASFPGEVYYVDSTRAFDNSELQCFRDEAHLTGAGKEILVNYIANETKRAGFVIQTEP